MNNIEKINNKRIERLFKIYLDAEAKIIQVISRQRELGLVDFSSVSELQQIQDIIDDLIIKSKKIIPKTIESQYKLGQKLAKIRRKNAMQGSSLYIVNMLTDQLEGKIINSAFSIKRFLMEKWVKAINFVSGNKYKPSKKNEIGRKKNDIFAKSVFSAVIASEATGKIESASDYFIKELQEKGITCFRDKKGREWRLSSYCNMATRTLSLQASNLGTISDDWDLYKMSSHHTTCPICAAYQGRVYSKSGTNPNYPPLASIFGKIDKAGPNVIENTYLNIHPNCLHQFFKYTEQGKSQKEIDRIREISSFKTNPPTINSQTRKEMDAYQKKVDGERKLDAAWKEWERLKLENNSIPRFQTFLKHKIANDNKYKSWIRRK